MSWGAFWMFYRCPVCRKKFKYATDIIEQQNFGTCPICGSQGILVAESGASYPADANDYEDMAE